MAQCVVIQLRWFRPPLRPLPLLRLIKSAPKYIFNNLIYNISMRINYLLVDLPIKSRPVRPPFNWNSVRLPQPYRTGTEIAIASVSVRNRQYLSKHGNGQQLLTE